MTAFRLQQKSWKDVAAYLENDDRILVPVGSTEQHGTFAPLGTDTYVAIALAEDASARTGVAVCPPLWYGWSPHHLVNPGTVTIRAEVLVEFVSDMLASLAEHGFKNFVIINGHRIVNISWMQIAAERTQRQLGVKVAIFDPAYMSKEIVAKLEFGPIGHAEDIEISHMLYRRPELVDLTRAVDNPQREKELYYLDPRDPRDTLCYVPATRGELAGVRGKTGDAIGGRPTQADAEKGRIYHEHLVARLIQVLSQMKSTRDV